MTRNPDLTNQRHHLIATDGACKGNPGRGGWGAIIQLREGGEVVRQRALAGRGPVDATNNRMELTAAIKGLERVVEPLPVIIISDSEYVVRSASEWLPGWKAAGWRNSGGAVKNRDLWEQLDALLHGRDVRWVWQRGHVGHDLNEMANHLADGAALGRYPKGEASVKERHPGWFLERGKEHASL